MVKFISFADRRMKRALARIQKQAELLGVFDSVECFDETTLMPDLSPWADHVRPGVPGLGYWVWKPYLILRELEKMKEGDILFYCDAGCHLNPRGRQRMQEYLEAAAKDSCGVTLFVQDGLYQGKPITEKMFCKGDVLDYFACRDRKDITDTRQMVGGMVFCRHCPEAFDLLKSWNQAWQHDFAMFDHSPSVSPNLDGFVAHRHDQSALSILYKLHGGTPFSFKECFTEGDFETELADYPIWVMRDKGEYVRPLMRLCRLKLVSMLLVGKPKEKYLAKIRHILQGKPYLRPYLPWKSS